jgi:hypothetical protein
MKNRKRQVSFSTHSEHSDLRNQSIRKAKPDSVGLNTSKPKRHKSSNNEDATNNTFEISMTAKENASKNNNIAQAGRRGKKTTGSNHAWSLWNEKNITEIISASDQRNIHSDEEYKTNDSDEGKKERDGDIDRIDAISDPHDQNITQTTSDTSDQRNIHSDEERKTNDSDEGKKSSGEKKETKDGDVDLIDVIFDTLPTLNERIISNLESKCYFSDQTVKLIEDNKVNMESLLFGNREHNLKEHKSSATNVNYNILFDAFVHVVSDKLNEVARLNALTICKRTELIDIINFNAEVLLLPYVLDLRLSNIFGNLKDSYVKFYQTGQKPQRYGTKSKNPIWIECLPYAKGKKVDDKYQMTRKSIKDNTLTVCTYVLCYFMYMYI